MNPLSVTLHSASNSITARVAGKLLTLAFHPPSGGAIPRGNYSLSAPMHNSVYGTFALLSVVRPAAGSGWINKGWVNPSVHPNWVNRGSLNRDWVSSGWLNQSGVNQGWVTQAGADWVQNPVSAASQPGVFVVVERPLAGRNTIVISGGFSELMTALQQAGGATVTVA